VSTFQRQKHLPGVVEHVSSGSRFRILIPRENCRITFVLGGLRAPRVGRQGEKGEDGAEEALEWTSRRAYQRDVEIEVETTDRAGGFIGTLYVNGNNIGKGLLEEGLAWVQGSSGGQEFDDAETRAKQSRKGIWKDWDESKENEKLATVNGGEPLKTRKEFIDVVVTNMNDDGSFGIQVIGDGVHALDKLMKEFRAFHDAGSVAAANVRVGDLVAARFSADNDFYRAKVKKVDRGAQKADVVRSPLPLPRNRKPKVISRFSLITVTKNLSNSRRSEPLDNLHSVRCLLKLKMPDSHSSHYLPVMPIMVLKHTTNSKSLPGTNHWLRMLITVLLMVQCH
jgi:staphylococcal nuclease domain-containing protein 1